MTWTGARDAVANAIAALTPTNTSIGRREWRHSEDVASEAFSFDREYAVRSLSMPQQMALGTGGNTPLWVTSFEVSWRRDTTGDLETDQDTVAQDFEQIQAELLDLSIYDGTDACGPIADGDTYFNTASERDDLGNTLNSITGVMLHS